MQRTADNNFVEFYMGSVVSEYRSLQAGHPVEVDMPFVRISIPGDINNQIDTRVEDYHKARYPVQWARFEANQTQEVQGWKLKDWPKVTTAVVHNYAHLGVHTVEQLAGLSDTQCQKVGMGAMELRLQAQAALASAKGVDTEKEAMKEQLAAMQAQLQAIAEAQGVDTEAKKRGGGRPKKIEPIEA